jgi:hypothetical protein
MSYRAGVWVILPFLVAGNLVGFGSAAAQELKFGFTPVVSEVEMRAEFDPLDRRGQSVRRGPPDRQDRRDVRNSAVGQEGGSSCDSLDCDCPGWPLCS